MEENKAGEPQNERYSLGSVSTVDAADHQSHPGVDDPILTEELPGSSSKKSIGDTQFQESEKVSDGLLPLVTQIIPFICSLAMSFATLSYVQHKFSADHFLRRLMIPADDIVQQALPALILFVFFWTVVDLFLKLIRIGKQNRFLGNDAAALLPKNLQMADATAALKSLLALPARMRNSHFSRRIIRLLEHLIIDQDRQKTHEHFRHQADIDSDIAFSGYSTVRVLIWAMPILGFIGTVIGIGIAVGNFSGFLSGDIEDIELVKRELSKVATGLSFAFNTTLLGLTASLFAMLFSTFVQKRDELSQKLFEELGLSIIVNAKVGHGQARPEYDDLPGYIAQTSTLMQEQIETVCGSVGELKKGINASAKMFLTILARLSEAVKGQNEILEKHQDHLVASLSSSLQEAEGKLGEGASKLAAGIDTAAQLFNDHNAHFVNALQKQHEILEQNNTQTLEGFSTILEKANSTLSGCANELGSSIEIFSQKIENNNGSSRELMERLSSVTGKLESNIAVNLSGLLKSSERAADAIEDVAPAQRITNKAIESVNELNGLLKELQDNQEKLMPILSKLAGPMELRLVPSRPIDES